MTSEVKTIAERFAARILKDKSTTEHNLTMYFSEANKSIYDWLRQQPENNPQNYFSIEQVEAVAREFHDCGVWDGDFDKLWQQKKQELEK